MGERLLIVKLSSLGDIVLALPALERLKAVRPELRVSWLVERRHRALLDGHPLLEEVLVVDTLGWRRRPLAATTRQRLPRALKALRERRFGCCADLQGSWKSGFLAWLSGAPRRIGPGRRREPASGWLLTERAPAPPGPHESELHQSVLDCLLAPAQRQAAPALAEPELPITARERDAMAERLAAVGALSPVVLNPGGGWISKRWPLESWSRLGRLLLERTAHAVFVAWGPGEQQLAERLLADWRSTRAISFETDVRQLAALLTQSTAFVGADTGPYHLARAAGCPSLGLFGPTDPARNGPLAPEQPVVWNAPECSPCYGRDCPGAIDCMQELSVAAAWDALRPLLAERRPIRRRGVRPGGATG